MKTGFIGAGNMGGAILRGAAAAGTIRACETAVFGVNKEKLRKNAEELGIRPYTDIEDIVKDCNVLFLGFKPQKFDEAIEKIKTTYTNDKIIVSMAAGISISYIERYLGKDAKIIRIMPNTPALVGCGMTSVSRNSNVNDDEFKTVFSILESVGIAEEVDEGLVDAVIGVSGSSPAFTYMYIDALAKEAEKSGMKRDTALRFSAQAVLGAAKMVLMTGESPEELRIKVCSPGGTTIEGVNELERSGFEEIVKKGAEAAVIKSKKMTKK